jgi:hypothetical protein
MTMFRNQSSLTDPELHPVLTERSIAYLHERAVPHDIAKACGLSSLTKHQIEYLLARDGANTSDGLGIPYKGHGEISWRVRLDEVPDQEKKNRWRWSKGEAVRPYFPPCIPAEVWQDVAEPIIITEGPIKSLAVWAAGHVSIGLAGMDTGHDPKPWQERRIAKLRDELLERVALQGRKVIIVADAGRMLNPMVANGEARFALALKNAGAVVYVAALPLRENNKDQGPDDFLVAKGGEKFQEILDAAELADPVARVQQAFQGTKKEASRKLYIWLDEFPFVASLAIGGSLVQDHCAFEAKPHVPRKLFTERVSRFKAQLVGKTLAAESGSDDVDEVINKMNEVHAIVRQGTNISILWEQEERYNSKREPRKVVEFYGQSDLELYYKNKTVWVDQGEGQPRKELSILRYWMKHPQRRTFDNVVFAPEGEPEGAYNLWNGWGVHPRKGDWSLLRAHLWENICSRNDGIFKWVMAWMANGVQNPAKKPGTAIVLRGKEGTGKGVLVSNYGALFGQHFLQVSNPKHFLGNFNAHLANCLFLFVDEAFWAGDKSSDGILKALITEDTLNIERKGQDVIKMANLIFLMMASNNDWVVPAGLEARRHCVLDVSESRMQDKEYFAAIQEQMDNGGREAFMYDLLHTDLTIADIRTVPKTAALLEQKIYSMTPIQQFWYNRLRDGSLDETATWKEAVPTAELYSMYIKESQLIGEKRRSRETEFGMQLKKLVPWCVKKKRVISAKAWGGGTEEKRLWCYFFPPLDECRKHFAAQLQEPGLDWEDEEGIVEDMNVTDSKTPASTTDRTSPAANAFDF